MPILPGTVTTSMPFNFYNCFSLRGTLPAVRAGRKLETTRCTIGTHLTTFNCIQATCYHASLPTLTPVSLYGP